MDMTFSPRGVMLILSNVQSLPGSWPMIFGGPCDVIDRTQVTHMQT